MVSKEKRNRFEQTSRTLERKYRCVQPKINLLKKARSYACETFVFLWNLPDVEEVPSHDGETVYSPLVPMESPEVPLRTAAVRLVLEAAKARYRLQSRRSCETKTETMRL
ncbi:hypothetical protein TNCV_129281 [Trichonephila clavipes]|nr:hypothetical protein TNCV_129281 [Trichonephila clavipes]